MPCRRASDSTFSGLRPTRMGSGQITRPSPRSIPPSSRMARMERTRCWLVPIRPVTPFPALTIAATGRPCPTVARADGGGRTPGHRSPGRRPDDAIMLPGPYRCGRGRRATGRFASRPKGGLRRRMEFDVLIRNGAVFDGTGAPPLSADVGIVGDRIEAVGDLSAATARLDLDAAGHAVAPGFIDTHTHSDLAWTLGPGLEHVAAASVRQGVTTEVCGNCGFSPFPHLSHRRGDVERHLRTLFGATQVDWHDLDGFAAAARRAGL